MALRMHEALGAAALLAVAAVPTLGQAPGSIPGVLAPSAAPELVQEGFVFTEGPVGTADGGLYFSDIRVSKIFYLDAGGKISMARENTNGANGLALTRDGELLFAEGDGKRITKRNKDGTITTVTEGPSGVPLLAPNDLLVDSKGGIAIDREDRVHITTVAGVQVFDAKGQYLGTIKVARQPANAAFAGPDKQTLYITAREGLYRVRTLAKGPDRLGK